MQETRELFDEYWPYILLTLSTVAGALAAIHAAMTKHDVRAAIGWVGITILSPLLGALLYLILGINRVRPTRIGLAREQTLLHYSATLPVETARLTERCGPQFASLRTLGNRAGRFPVTDGNSVQPLDGGLQTYRAMRDAIDAAQHTVALQTYIFDNDTAGREIAEALIRAAERGVQVRVLIDAVGSKYSIPPIVARLNRGKVPTALFNPNPLFFWRMPYANLRCHRKILIVDTRMGFTGGMNIRRAFVETKDGVSTSRDTHFAMQGPVVRQLLATFAHDWGFTNGESLANEIWFPIGPDPRAGEVPVRCVPTGPDRYIGSTHKMLLGALAIAQRHVRIQSPYFLPDQALIGALATTARRGVRVDILIPGSNNLRLVDYAMTAQLDQVIRTGCRVWRGSGTFDHSKIMTVDDAWSYIGSSNLDPRSLRLNFELDSEIYDPDIAQWLGRRIDQQVAQANRVTLSKLYRLPFLKRLRNKLIWLASPYL